MTDERLNELFEANTTTKNKDGRIIIDCKMGKWGVSFPDSGPHYEQRAREAAMRYFKQNLDDGNYPLESTGG